MFLKKQTKKILENLTILVLSEYVQILSNGHDGMEGWINLFFNDEIVALINNDYLASQIKQSIPERH